MHDRVYLLRNGSIGLYTLYPDFYALGIRQ